MHMPKAAKHVWNIISTALVVLVVLFAVVLLGVRLFGIRAVSYTHLPIRVSFTISPTRP